jgi:hypothetical protein
MTHQALSPERADEPSIEELADEIATLSATISAATYQLLGLVGELDRRGGWADPLDANGFRSCAHWLSWRVRARPFPTQKKTGPPARERSRLPLGPATDALGSPAWRPPSQG